MEPATERVFGLTPKAATSYQSVADHLLREIALGKIVAGEKLPPERALAEELGVARETLRQALRILEGSGQVEVRRGASGGAFVLPKAGNRRVALEDLRARREEILQALELRSVIESSAAALAAVRRDASDLKSLDTMQTLLLKADSLDEARRVDTAFHAIIAHATLNPLLEKSIEDARVLMFGVTDQTFFEFQTRSSYDGHALVLDAIRAGDAAGAEQAMKQHITTTTSEFEALLNSASPLPLQTAVSTATAATRTRSRSSWVSQDN